MERNCRYFLISGRVQGVSYRAYTRRQALALGLTGEVRNLSDGRVEAIAVGPQLALEQFEKALLKGPPHAEVVAVVAKQIAQIPTYEGFLIVEDGETPWFDF